MKFLILALFVSFSPMLFASESNIPECAECMMFDCSLKDSSEIVARFQLGAEPTERLTFENIHRGIYINSYYYSSDDNYLYLVDKSDFTVRASKSIYDDAVGAGEILIQQNGETIKNGEYTCKKANAVAAPMECRDNPQDCEIGSLRCKFTSSGIYKNEIELEEKFRADDDAYPFAKNRVRWLMNEEQQEYLDIHVLGRPFDDIKVGASINVTHWIKTGPDSAKVLHRQSQGLSIDFDSTFTGSFMLIGHPIETEKQFSITSECVFHRIK